MSNPAKINYDVENDILYIRIKDVKDVRSTSLGGWLVEYRDASSNELVGVQVMGFLRVLDVARKSIEAQ